jgi:acetyl esterase/lipase
MSWSWAFLIVSLVGAWFTVNAFFPTRRWQLITLSFFAGWLTNELAWFHILWQMVATVVFVWLGALDSWPGVLALAITVVSWAGLLWAQLVSRRSAAVLESALRDALGDDYRSEIAPGLAEHLAARTPRRELLLPFSFRDRRVERIKDIEYAPGAGRRHRLDVWRPRVGVEHAPVLFQIHGGAWVIGDKGQQALPLMTHLAANGWVCVAANYRLSPRVNFPEHLIDCKLALRWIREHVAEFGGDPDFVVVTGGSAGGHLAALVGLTANDPAYQPGFRDIDTAVTAAVPIYGVYDMTETFRYRGASARGSRWMERRVMGATFDEDPELFRRASPVSRVRADAPPFFVIHGANDNLVPVDQARRFVAALRAVSHNPVAYAEIPGATHAFEIFHSVRTANTVNAVDRYLAWLYSAYQAKSGIEPTVGGVEAVVAASGLEPVNGRTTTSRTAPS